MHIAAAARVSARVSVDSDEQRAGGPFGDQAPVRLLLKKSRKPLTVAIQRALGGGGGI